MPKNSLKNLLKELEDLHLEPHSPPSALPKIATTEEIEQFNRALNTFERERVAEIKEAIASLGQMQHTILQQTGMVGSQQCSDLLNNALEGIAQAHTLDRLEAFLTNFNYVLTTLHPETALLPVNSYLEAFYDLLYLEEQRFDTSDPKWQAAFQTTKNKVENEKTLFAVEARHLIEEFETQIFLLELEKNPDQSRLEQYKKGIEKIKALQNELDDLHQLLLVKIPNTNSLEEKTKLIKKLHQDIDNLHHLAALDEERVNEFLIQKKQLHKWMDEFCLVRGVYLKSEEQHNSEVVMGGVWEAIQAFTNIAGLPGSGKVIQTINNIFASQTYNYASLGLAAADTVLSVQGVAESDEIGDQPPIEQPPKEPSSLWQTISHKVSENKKASLGLVISVAGLVTAAVLAFNPVAGPVFLLASLIIGVVGMVWSIFEVGKTTWKEHKRDQKSTAALESSHSDIHEHLRSKNKLRNEHQVRYSKLSSEAKIDLLLMGHKSDETLSVTEHALLKKDLEKMKQQDWSPPQPSPVSKKIDEEKTAEESKNQSSSAETNEDSPELKLNDEPRFKE